MKIIYVLPINWGGIPHYAAELANAVSKYEEVIIIKSNSVNDNLFSKKIQIINAFSPLVFKKGSEKKVFCLTNLKSLFTYKNVKLIHELNPDIIHFPGTYIHASFFSKLYKLNTYPIVITKHSVADSYLVSSKNKSFFSTHLWKLNDLSKYFFKSDVFVVHTLENKQALTSAGIEPQRIAIIPHGSYTFFKNYSKSSQENTNCKTTEQKEDNSILYFGYIGPHKGVEYLIEAIPLIYKEIPSIKIIIAGEGDLSGCVKNKKNNSSFEIHNEFIPDSKVHEFFERAKVVVLPYTYHQGLSGVMAIAFAFGKPLVVTDVGNLSQFAKNSALVVPSMDSKAISEAIIKLLKDDKLRLKLSENSYQRGVDLSWDNIAKEYLKVYNSLL